MPQLDDLLSLAKDGWLSVRRWFAIRRFRASREQFYVDLAEAVKDKEPIAKFLSIRRTRATAQKDPFASLYQRCLDRLEKKGGSLSYMLQGLVPENDLMVLSSIETRGDVNEGLEFLASTVKSQRAMRTDMIVALTVPAIVTVVSMGFLILLSFWVIPLYETIVPPEKWNTMGKSIHAVTYGVRHYGVLVAIAIFALVWAFTRSLTYWSGARRAKLDNYLPYRVFRDYTGSVFLVALASLMVSGETLVKSLETLRKRASPWLRWHIKMIERRLLTHSANYGEAFSTGIFNRELSNRLIDKTRRTGNFSEVIRQIGIEGIEAAREQVKRSTRSLNFALIFVLGGLIAYLFLGTLYTTQGLSQGIRDSVKQHRALKR